jgi:hypothetical protein
MKAGLRNDLLPTGLLFSNISTVLLGHQRSTWFCITNSASVTVSPYPPFGLMYFSFLPLATYIILVAIYSSAVSLAQNILLCKSIRDMTRQDTNLRTSQYSYRTHGYRSKRIDSECWR